MFPRKIGSKRYGTFTGFIRIVGFDEYGLRKEHMREGNYLRTPPFPGPEYIQCSTVSSLFKSDRIG